MAVPIVLVDGLFRPRVTWEVRGKHIHDAAHARCCWNVDHAGSELWLFHRGEWAHQFDADTGRRAYWC